MSVTVTRLYHEVFWMTCRHQSVDSKRLLAAFSHLADGSFNECV